MNPTPFVIIGTYTMIALLWLSAKLREKRLYEDWARRYGPNLEKELFLCKGYGGSVEAQLKWLYVFGYKSKEEYLEEIRNRKKEGE